MFSRALGRVSRFLRKSAFLNVVSSLLSLFQTRKLEKVEREPYNGPVITLPSSEPPAIVSPSQRKQKFQEHKKSGASRDLHRSGFELSGE